MSETLNTLLSELESTVSELTKCLEQNIPPSLKPQYKLQEPAQMPLTPNQTPVLLGNSFDALQEELDQLRLALQPNSAPSQDMPTNDEEKEMDSQSRNGPRDADPWPYGVENIEDSRARDAFDAKQGVLEGEKTNEEEEEDERPLGTLISQEMENATYINEIPVPSGGASLHNFQRLVKTVHEQYKSVKSPARQQEHEKSTEKLHGDRPAYTHSEKIKAALHKMQEANIVKTPIRIYINDTNTFKTIQATSLMTIGMILRSFFQRGVIDPSEEWAVFEEANDWGMERAVREWEIVTDIVGTWDIESTNRLVVVRYPYRDTLTVSSVLGNSYPQLFGWLYVEIRKGKWQKRFVHWREDCLYYSKDNKGANETFLCSIKTYDVYTVKQPVRKAPTKFLFALKSQERSRHFENSDDYLHMLCAEHMEKMKDWVLSIRVAKNHLMYETYPDRVKDPLKPIPRPPISADFLNIPPLPPPKNNASESFSYPTESSGGNIKSHDEQVRSRAAVSVNTGGRPAKKNLPQPLVTLNQDPPLTPRSPNPLSPALASGSGGKLLSFEDELTFAQGSLLANREELDSTPRPEQPPSNISSSMRKSASSSFENVNGGRGGTLVQLDEKLRFQQGSLLATTSSAGYLVATPAATTTLMAPTSMSNTSFAASQHHHKQYQQQADQSSKTLLQLNESEPFTQGSLLAKRLPAPPAIDISNKNLPSTVDEDIFKEGSLLAKNRT
ncbi:uncharacterized protein VTP21DRAFT_5819 [Calcarisporiella thermophila]|uniref:uncharacterized protein n=1 Tax=Calcarisporiella thermophila TaxID=911321 RepID=UPI0037431FF8